MVGTSEVDLLLGQSVQFRGEQRRSDGQNTVGDDIQRDHSAFSQDEPVGQRFVLVARLSV